MRKVNNVLIKHIQRNIITYFVVIMFFLIGISSGAFTTKALSDSENGELIAYLENFFKIVDTKTIDNFAILKQSLINNLQTGVLIWILGVTIIGIPAILFLIGLRGFIIGFTVGFIIKQKGLKGLIFSIFSLLPQNIIIIPGIIVTGVLGISFSVMLIKSKVEKNVHNNILNQFFVYSTVIAIVYIFIALGCIIEAYISPLFVKYLSVYM
ncbi:stage II sporulation protein M [Caminicella sporogenes DSM 14501]|uniref:Stage II sporulation protein M n=1 Tax=Caminicella sporogenes DSM 14501 TaxID=1121266 RepID=A0A1M6LKF4_9FIRM|nr:stage II sporulation protein M [Caminicella sporogenes]SHJ71635.1 stage II sporulation protein M [Caminicella sporogenes DSM 14501]